MVGLTSAECTVVGSILAAMPRLERDRIRESGLSPRTYETARRRLFERGVVLERYVPNPCEFGVPWVTIRLYSGSEDSVVRAHRDSAQAPGCAVLWTSESFALSVSFSSTA